ncbi:Hypothetical protein I595_2645 [Croceitalea dokdonensis DOKDO 023]|uniref:Uncharacterized protein n=1 Tax=Croceitalea dokdonensis DOKDO 023 TaxID=1300341 RepID=A0A0P7A4M6_9FLAO|nr:Hypothetical protein I595_2645 [Croceitalea dokdonensis DOKDO 023]
MALFFIEYHDDAVPPFPILFFTVVVFNPVLTKKTKNAA